MPLTTIKTSGTTQIKTGQGILQAVIVVAPGTTWNAQFNDGPNPNAGGAFTPLIGSTTTALVVPAIGTFLLPVPIPFSNGLQVVTTGATPGEITLVWQ